MVRITVPVDVPLVCIMVSWATRRGGPGWGVWLSVNVTPSIFVAGAAITGGVAACGVFYKYIKKD